MRRSSSCGSQGRRCRRSRARWPSCRCAAPRRWALAKLEAHAHVHWVVPGGGPALQAAAGWKQTCKEGRDNPYYLVNADALRRRFRACFLEGLQRLHQRGELKLEGDFAYLQEEASWQALIDSLGELTWVVYIEPPPKQGGDVEQVVKYLARYLTGGPISDRRLISIDATHVEFWAREGTVAGGERRQVPVRLPIAEFVRRWSLHILPKGYTKMRRFGGWSPRHRDAYVERCAILLESRSDADQLDVSFDDGIFAAEADDASLEAPMCPCCGEPMELLSVAEQPRWSEVMSSPGRPFWYRRPG